MAHGIFVVNSTLDKITNNHAGNAPFIAADCKRKATIDEAFLFWRFRLLLLTSRLGRTRPSRHVKEGFVSHYTGCQDSFLTGVESDVAVFLHRSFVKS